MISKKNSFEPTPLFLTIVYLLISITSAAAAIYFHLNHEFDILLIGLGIFLILLSAGVLYLVLNTWYKRLHSAHHLLRTIIDLAPVRIFWKNKNLEYMGCNTAFAQDAGKHDIADVIGKTDYQLAWKEQAELYRADDRRVIETLESKLSFEEPQTTPQGDQIWLNTSKVPLRDECNEVIGVLGVYADITDQKNIEFSLIQERNNVKNYLDIVGVIILVLDDKHNVQLINQHGASVLGYSPDEIIGKNWVENFVPLRLHNQLYAVAEEINASMKDGISYFENPIITKSGEERLIAWRNRPLFDEHGSNIGILSSGEDITERKKAENDLIESQQHLQSIIANEPECVKLIDQGGRLIDMNPAGLAMLEADTLEVAQQSKLTSYILPEWRSAFIQLHHKVMSGESGQLEFEIRGLKGTRRWLETHAVPMRDAHGNVTMLLGITRDITQRKETEDELIKLSHALQQSPNVVIITDQKARIEYVNNAFVEMTGYTKEEVIGKNPKFLRSDKNFPEFYAQMWETIKTGKVWHGELINRRKDGSEYTYTINISPVLDAHQNITHYIAIQEDITNRKEAEEQIHFLANFDPLTNLPNRRHLNEHFQYILAMAKRKNDTFSVMFLDLDHFKEINDSLGHSYGDALLQKITARMKSILREEDVLSRLGGDEFILILPDANSNGAAYIAERLLNAIGDPVLVEEHELMITGSIGIALYPNDGSDMETLLKNADSAMYRAKQEGRNNYSFFTDEMQKRSTRNLQLTNALRNALKNDELHLVYQPQISLSEKKIIGAEALLRWDSPEFGSVSPAEFIPIAENSGLILQIGEWVLRAAVEQTKAWMDQGFEPIIVAVNLSAIQFRHNSLPETITQILDEAGLPAEYLEIELTESVAMDNPQKAIKIMDRLHERGIRMSIDDFGTGYSSLNYLKKFKVYKLKIDQTFVRDISVDAEDRAIVSAIISMGKHLGLQTIAEGVETIGQIEFLRNEQCDEVQGYFFSKPLRPEEFELYRAAFGIE